MRERKGDEKSQPGVWRAIMHGQGQNWVPAPTGACLRTRQTAGGSVHYLNSHTTSPEVLSSASWAYPQLCLGFLPCPVTGDHPLPRERESIHLDPAVLPHTTSPRPTSTAPAALLHHQPRTGPGIQQALHDYMVNECVPSSSSAGAQGI